MPRSPLGLAATSYLPVWETIDAIALLERARGFGASGIHAVINVDPVALRSRADEYEMYIEAMVLLPAGDGTGEFEASLKVAQKAGASTLRAACLPTRRYETFETLEDWQMHVRRSYASLEAALPLLERNKIPLGLENHKDWTNGEMLTLLKHFSSEYLGVCLDLANNLALLETPQSSVEALAPFTVTTHFKDVAVASDPDGFRMAEVPLGEGCLDLPSIVNKLQEYRPQVHLNLEMITRDPLIVPALSNKYWTTLREKTSRDLALALRFVDENANDRLPSISGLSAADRADLENRNIAKCMRYFPR